MKGFFIDKLNVIQDHETANNVDFADRKFYVVDVSSGDVVTKKDQISLEGSHSSKIWVASNGYRVEVYGNPSKWNRVDNLFGLETLEECFTVYNGILRQLGLPEFTKCTRYLYHQNPEDKTVTKSADGAMIQHIDFTRNMAVGEGNQQAFIRGLATQSISRSIKPYLYPDHNTVDWFGKNLQRNGSTFRYIKVYNKLVDLFRNQKKNLKGADDLTYQYYEKLLQFVEQQGVCREEHSFKRKYLRRKNLFAYGLFKQEEFLTELGIIDELRQRISVNNMKYQTIADQLLEQGVVKTRQAANATQNYYLLWLHGQYFDRSKSQYRVHKSRLLQLGIDISVKLDISHAPIRLKETQIIEVKPLQMPDWYRKATVHQLNKVA